MVRLYGLGLNSFKMEENFTNIDGTCNYKSHTIFIKCLQFSYQNLHESLLTSTGTRVVA